VHDDDGGGGGYGQYSDVSSHGTYAQPPIAHAGPGETYGMRELGRGPSPGPAPGEIYNAYPTPNSTQYGSDAGAAGIG